MQPLAPLGRSGCSGRQQAAVTNRDDKPCVEIPKARAR